MLRETYVRTESNEYSSDVFETTILWKGLGCVRFQIAIDSNYRTMCFKSYCGLTIVRRNIPTNVCHTKLTELLLDRITYHQIAMRTESK